jgi:hypothetical protein
MTGIQNILKTKTPTSPSRVNLCMLSLQTSIHHLLSFLKEGRQVAKEPNKVVSCAVGEFFIK